MKYRSSSIISITISSGVSSASIGESNVAVSADGSTWKSSIPATDLKKNSDKTGSNSEGDDNGSTVNNNSGSGW